MRKRDKAVLMRLTENELALLEKKIKLSKLTKEAYLRKMCLREEAIIVVDRQLLLKIYAEINRIGNNINQIAHVANSCGNIRDDDLKQVIDWQRQLQLTVSRELGGVR